MFDVTFPNHKLFCIWSVCARLGLRALLVMLAILIVSQPNQSCNAETILNYAIGNSLTGDLNYGFPGKGFDMINSTNANPTSTGVHLEGGQSLAMIRVTPSTPNTIAVPATYTDVLANNRTDNLFLQPSYGASVGAEIAAIKSFIDLAKLNPLNSNTRFFLYATWAHRVDQGNGQSFFDTWTNFQPTLSGDFVPSKNTYDLMLSELRQSGYEISLIPAGHAWHATLEAVRNGQVIDMTFRNGTVETFYPLSETNLYRDNVHADTAGAFIAGLAAHSAIYGTKPVGLNQLHYTMQEFFAQANYLSSSGARALEDITWNAYLRAIPEPNSCALAIVFSLSLVSVRRRRN